MCGGHGTIKTLHGDTDGLWPWTNSAIIELLLRAQGRRTYSEKQYIAENVALPLDISCIRRVRQHSAENKTKTIDSAYLCVT